METQIGFVPTMSHYQDNQREEWKLELMFRVENYLCTMGAIPTDQFSTMRLHPDFQSDIYPLINKLRDTLGTVAGEKSALFHSNLNLQLLLE